MKVRKNRVVRSKLKLKGKFAKSRRRKEREIKRELIEEREKELLSKIELFGNNEADALLESSKELQQRLKLDPFIRDFVNRESLRSRAIIEQRFGKQIAEDVKLDFKIVSINHEIVEIKQSFSEVGGKQRFSI